MSGDPWEDLLQQGGGGDPWESLLASGGVPQREPFDIDTENDALGHQGPLDQRQWYNKPWDEALGEAAPGALDTLRGAAVGITGAFGANMSDTPQAMESAQRSPMLFGGAKLASEIGGQAAALPVGEIGGLASGALGGLLSGYGNTSGDTAQKLQGGGEGALWGAAGGRGGELVGNVASKVGGWFQDTAAPWLRDQGLLNRAASTGKPMAALSKEFGGRQGVIDAGQWMENNGLTQWSPNKLQSGVDDIVSSRTADQGRFLDDLAANPDAYPVDVNPVTQDLMGKGYDQSALAAPAAQQQGSQYMQVAGNLADVAPDGQMDFQTAWRNRQGFDQGAKWQQGANGDQGLAAVNRDAANGMRGAMGESLDNTAPQLRDQWEGIQGDISTGLGLSGGGDAALGREFGGTPSALQFGPMAAAAGAGPVGYATTLAAKTGGRGMMADALGGSSQALDWLGSQGDNVAGGAQALGRESGEEFSGEHNSRGYLLPQAAQQMMQQPGALGPYEKQFHDAYKDPDSNALSALIVRLSNTDSQFKREFLPKLQQLTAGGY